MAMPSIAECCVGLFVCIFLSICGDVDGAISSPPLNAVAVVDGHAIFNCSATPGPYAWILTRDGNVANGEIRIATSCAISLGLENHYRTEQPGGTTTCSLIIFNITMEQAGVYHCTESDIFRALLTVIDSTSTMTFNNTPDVMETEKVDITCFVNFNGSSSGPNLRPHYYWTDSKLQNVSDFVQNLTENKAVSELSVKAGRENIEPYTCHVYLKLDPPGNSGYANNTPSVSNSVSSPTIDVLYGIGPVTIRNSTYDGDVILTCTTTGNPAPSYYWTSSNYIANSTVQTVQTEVVGYFECNATNVIRNYTYSNASEVNVTHDCVRTDYVLVTVIPYFIKNLIVLGICIICINCNKDFGSGMTTQFKWMMKLQGCSENEAVEIVFCVCFIIGSLAIGLVMIPIFITIAFCSESKGSGKKWMLVFMWCLVVVALVPISFIIVYFGPCQEERLVVA